jgi:hypothetical protein
MSATMKGAPGVEIVLLRKHLAVVSLAVDVLTAPGLLRRSPPTVSRVR